MTAARGVIVAAPASRSGKTVVTLAVLRQLRQLGMQVAACKVGPDYIDPRFHEAATGRPCFNLDGWAMRPATLAHLVARAAEEAQLIVAEGVMGLFDGASDGTGSTADLAAATGWLVVLVVDVAAQGPSVAAIVHGFRTWRREVEVAAVILNRVAGAQHEAMLRAALAPLGVPVLGALPRSAALTLSERHLGLVQAGEHGGLGAVLDRAAAVVGEHVDVRALAALARPCALALADGGPAVAPLGQRIAVAADAAFAFCYAHLASSWREQGAELRPFSPLADEVPEPGADAVFLPGGYPELHAGRLAGNRAFLDGLRRAADRQVPIYGECGGYMVLGDVLEDAAGNRHAMAGLLPVATSFAHRRLHLGYRRAVTLADGPLGARGTALRGHEFHYAALLHEPAAAALLDTWDARGTPLGAQGARRGSVAGSFFHLVDREA